MQRRRLLGTGVSVLLAALAGCGSLLGGDTGDETPTPLPDDTVRLGPSSPGCPDGEGGESWGMMFQSEHRYNAAVSSADDARLVAERLANDTANASFTLVEPEPERIAWKGSIIDVSDRYGTDEWYLFTPSQTRTDRVGLLVLGGNSTRSVQFVVGPC